MHKYKRKKNTSGRFEIMELTLRLLWFFSIAGLSSDAWLSPFLEANFGWVTFPELPFTPMAPDTIFYKYIH